MNNKDLLYGYLAPIATIAVLVTLIAISFFSLFYRTKTNIADYIAEDVAQLVGIFKSIDDECEIIDFDYQKNIINFLNIKKDGFVGSEVGSMNLVHPKNWNGPYLMDNPTMRDKEYQIVWTERGHFITPGDGVKLPNGKVVGVDIILDDKADILSMMRDENALLFKGKALAAPLNLKRSPMDIDYVSPEQSHSARQVLPQD